MPEDRHPGTPGGGSGADVKSGTELAIGDGNDRQVIFGTAFTSTPRVVACIGGQLYSVDIVCVHAVTTTGFYLKIYKGHGGSAHSWDVFWIATDAGDP